MWEGKPYLCKIKYIVSGFEWQQGGEESEGATDRKYTTLSRGKRTLNDKLLQEGSSAQIS